MEINNEDLIASVDRVLVEFIEKIENPESVKFVAGQPELKEARVFSMGVDSRGIMNEFIRNGDTVFIAPGAQGLPIRCNGKNLILLKHHQIELYLKTEENE